jgi:putative transposase
VVPTLHSACGGPTNVRAVWLPPYCPELNPIERFWRDLKDDLAWQQFVDLEA